MTLAKWSNMTAVVALTLCLGISVFKGQRIDYLLVILLVLNLLYLVFYIPPTDRW